MDKTLGYILCTQSPGLFLAALMLLSTLGALVYQLAYLF